MGVHAILGDEALRAGGRLFVLAAIALLMVVVRVGLGARAEYRLATQAVEAGDDTQAVRHFEASAHWYLPGSPWAEPTFVALHEIAARRAAAGDIPGAVAALSAVRGAILGARSLYTPHSEWLDRTNAAMAEIWLSDPDGSWPDPALSEAARRSEAAAVLNSYSQPSPGWSALAVLAFVAWVAGAVGFVLRGFDRDGALQRRAAASWGGAVLLAFALWLIGMARA